MNGTRFKWVRVQPAYGSNSALIRWAMQDDRDNAGNFYLYRSVDGVTWTDSPINEDSPVTGMCEYLDTSAEALDMDAQLQYRILWQDVDTDAESESGPVGVFHELTRLEFGIVREILNLELRNMRDAQQGIPLLLLRPKTRGERCPACYNPLSGTSTQGGVCTICYGTSFKGGYGTPMETYGIILNSTKITTAFNGSSNMSDRQHLMRLLAYPQLSRNDVLVNVASDERFVVGAEGSEVFPYKGIFPVAQNATVHLLRRGDVTYKFPIA